MIYPLVIVIETEFGPWEFHTKTHNPDIRDKILKSNGIGYDIYSGHENGHFVWVERNVPIKDLLSIQVFDPLYEKMAKEFIETFPSFRILYDSGLKQAETRTIKDYSRSWCYLPIVSQIRRFINPQFCGE